MTSNDMSVIIYKVLEYAQECGKSGGTPDIEKARELADNPNSSWWCSTIRSTLKEDLIAGVRVQRYVDGTRVVVADDFEITHKGTCYLRDSTTMHKAKQVAGQAFLNALSAAVFASVPSVFRIG